MSQPPEIMPKAQIPNTTAREFERSISDLLSDFKDSEQKISAGIVRLSREVESLSFSLNKIKQSIHEEVKRQVDVYLSRYLTDVNEEGWDQGVKVRIARITKPSKSTVPPPKFKGNSR